MSSREELVGAAFELASEGLLLFADDGRWIEANREAYRLLAGAGRPVDELIGGIGALLEAGAARGSFDTALGRVEFRASARIADGAHLLVLRQADEARLESSLLATLNRELRVPLTGVVGVCGLLEATALDRRQREYLDALRVSADALAGVVEGLLDYSALGGILLAAAEEPFDLRTVLEEVAAVGALAAGDTPVELFCHVDPQLPAIVRGDERRVRQVLMTLVGNAVKFTLHGEIVVEAALAEHADGRSLIRFGVSDTGIGIDARGREAIFEAFAAAADDGAAGAAGLGLAVARRLVGAMGGELGVESEPGEGTALWFELPLRTDPAEAAAAPMQGGLEGARVLVVDARPARARRYVRALEDWGALATIAADRAGALTQLHAALDAGCPHDLVLAGRDLADAAELARQIAGDPALACVRTVLAAAPGELDARGADAVLAGPFGRRRAHAELAGLLAAGAVDPPPARVGSGRVLLAEDSSVNELVAVTLLEERGFQVDVARNGVEALALHAQRGYDAIFMDCEMPELDGYETTREIRRREGDERHTPIIAMTASTLPDERERCVAAGMDYHTGKPIRPAGLDYVIARAIRAPAPARSPMI